MKTRSIFGRIFCAITALIFGFLFLKIVFADTIHQYATSKLLLWFAAGVVFLRLAFWGFTHIEAWLEKYYFAVLAVFLTVYELVILRLGFLLRFTPSFDMDAIYGGAIQWLTDGTFSDYYEYYGYFPNNLGGMAFLHVFFKIASFFGIQDYFAVGIVINSLLITATALTVSLCCRCLKGVLGGVMALCVMALCVPFYFMGAAFYTDSLSLLFPVLFYYLYLQFQKQETWQKRGLFAALMSVVFCIGILIKFTVAIVLIAVFLDALLALGGSWKERLAKLALLVACPVLLGAATHAAFSGYIYAKHLDREQCEQLNTPYLHWVMMGLVNNGSYNAEDYEYTRSFAPEERNAACLDRIRERVEDLGVSGLAKLFVNKALICFGDGTYALSDFLDDTPENETTLQDYILYAGENYKSYQHFSTGLLLICYFGMVLSAGRAAFRRRQDATLFCLAPRLCAVGILLFLLLWETSGRYFTNFVPMLVISAVLLYAERLFPERAKDS